MNYYKQQSEVLEQLNEWNGSQIEIEKNERHDSDKISMKLTGANFIRRDETIDGYVSRNALQLNGDGKISTTSNENASLPFERYDIALDQINQLSCDSSSITMETDRGTYKIKVK